MTRLQKKRLLCAVVRHVWACGARQMLPIARELSLHALNTTHPMMVYSTRRLEERGRT